MTNDKFIEASEQVNLNNCDRELIHIPGAIQPHGLLLVLTEPDLTIAQVSENALEIVGVEPAKLLDRPLANFLNPEDLDAIRACLEDSFEHINPLPLVFHSHNPRQFNGIVHRSPSGEIILELEPSDAGINGDFFLFYRQVKHNLARIQRANHLGELCNLIVQEVRSITGFDRVMVYRFNAAGEGTVIAEAKQPDLESYLGLHYPDSDIPKQAKYLYRLNWLRLIPDVNYQPVGLLSSGGAEERGSRGAEVQGSWGAGERGSGGAEVQRCRGAEVQRSRGEKDPPRSPAPLPPSQISPLDMTFCVLRSVSPIHIEYLKNMEVAASMSISLIHQQGLWGLIACHHNQPKFVPYETRTICEFLGQVMSTEISNKQLNENLDYQLQLKDILGQLVERLTRSTDFIEPLTTNPELLLKLAGASGAAICAGDDIRLIGETPDKEVIPPLLTWLRERLERDLFVTDSLPRVYPAATTYKNVASGLLAIAISKVQHRYVLWFRPELLHTVTWAGNPNKPKRIEADGSLSIFPRQSFKAWQETVRLKSSPWFQCEIDGVVELRQAIIDIVLRQAEELASINLELQRSNSELDAFAYIASHDLKEPLRGIHNYATFLLEDYAEILPEEGTEKLQTLVRLTQRMESLISSLLRFSRLGRQELQMQPLDLNQLLRETAEIFEMNPQWAGCVIRLPRTLPVIWGDRLLVGEIFTNLISNGLKYNNNSDKWVEIGWLESNPDEKMTTLYVRDNGIGIRDKHLESVFKIFKRLHAPGKYGGGTGAGLTIVKKIVERHGGNIRIESVYGAGTTFWLTLPAVSPTTAEEK
ncbi:MAG: hypothetical protein Fur0025_14810 [Oscillatoriaceae cyanobacterium]